VSRLLGQDTGVIKLDAVMEVNAVLCHGWFIQMVKSEVPMVSFNHDLNGTSSLSDIDLGTFWGYAAYINKQGHCYGYPQHHWLHGEVLKPAQYPSYRRPTKDPTWSMEQRQHCCSSSLSSRQLYGLRTLWLYGVPLRPVISTTEAPSTNLLNT
jgi:hypothetical protein